MIISFSGTVKGEEIYDLNKLLMSDASFSQWRYQIWDFSEAVDIEITMEQLRGFAVQDSIAVHKSPDQRIAIIPRKKVHSGLDTVFHVYEQAWGGYESKTFADVDAAKEWADGRVKE